MAMPHNMCLPALAAGNTVVLKPSEETPLIAQAYVDALNTVLPKDVLIAVHGEDDQGKAPDLDPASMIIGGRMQWHVDVLQWGQVQNQPYDDAQNC